MIRTKDWAESLGIDTRDNLQPLAEHIAVCERTSEEVAARTVILHAIAAAGDGIDRTALVEWLNAQNLWENVSPREQTFFLSKKLFREDLSGALWLMEAQWALLWSIQKVESLGLPVKTCDTHKIINEIMPALGDDIHEFVSSAKLRDIREILAEKERIDRIFSAYQNEEGEELPEDLIYAVLIQRQNAFKWLNGEDDWDNV